MVILIKILQVLLCLSILVIVHEFGHFIAAKIFKTKVEKFYLFFDPWFSIFKFTYKGTEYGMGWLPFGGYVKIAGMIDESMDKEAMSKPPQPWEFRSKPAWQRLIIMVGGVFMNVVLAFVIYIALLFSYGEQYLSTSEVNRYGIAADSLARELGFCNGDKILTIDGQYIENFSQIPLTLILDGTKTVEVERDNKKVIFELPANTTAKLLKHQSPLFLTYRIPFIVQEFSENSVAKAVGAQIGDTVIGINGEEARYFQDFREKIQQHKNQEVVINFKRGNDTLNLAMQLPEDGLMGVYPQNQLTNFFDISEKKYNFFEAIPAGFTKTIDGIGDYLKQLKLLVSPEVKAYENVGGFIAIGKIFPDKFRWESFWRLTAFLSIMLAVVNLLPIPALDGGHVMFLLYEIIVRHKPSEKFMETAQVIGMIILFGLIIFANGNDIIKLFK
ncbi:MAG: RIP metalloprotease RseP [Lentimicrobiaceae bacterium]|jgi:regulator of sigma E protease|nr:RIP metalloprotease RseP [Lentimicrobiaceae bacterium]